MSDFSFEYFDQQERLARTEIRDLEDKLEEKKERLTKLIYQKIAWQYSMMRKIFGNQSTPLND